MSNRLLFFILALAGAFYLIAEPAGSDYPDVHVYPETAKLEISDRVKKNLDYAYSGMKKEFPLCLFGEQADSTLRVTGLGVPRVLASDEVSARYTNVRCRARSDFLGMAHNHGKGFCAPSDTDLERFFYHSKAKIEVITCQVSGKTEIFGIVKKDAL